MINHWIKYWVLIMSTILFVCIFKMFVYFVSLFSFISIWCINNQCSIFTVDAQHRQTYITSFALNLFTIYFRSRIAFDFSIIWKSTCPSYLQQIFFSVSVWLLCFYLVEEFDNNLNIYSVIGNKTAWFFFRTI